MEPWPAERMKRSRSNQVGSLGLCLRNCVHSVKAMAAAPIGMPGCPAFAFCTASAERMRMVLMHRSSSVVVAVKADDSFRAKSYLTTRRVGHALACLKLKLNEPVGTESGLDVAQIPDPGNARRSGAGQGQAGTRDGLRRRAREHRHGGPPDRCHRAQSRARRSEEHTTELQSLRHLVCRLLLEKK